MKMCHLALSAMAAVLIMGCGGRWISRDEAYRLDVENCEARKDPEKVRVCKSFVEKRYRNYFANGSYPDTSHIPSPQR